MTTCRHHMRAKTVSVAAVACALMGASAVFAQQAPATAVFEDTIPPGDNFNVAQFRLWLPPGAAAVRGVVVMVPGSNGDWRSMAADTAWQAFATKHALALVGCRFTDKPHEQSFIEDYVNVSKGSGQALETALTKLATSSRHAELASAPLFLWGMSAGGQFNYEFVAWKPERVAAFVVNKGGIYYKALLSRAARAVPGILFTGATDLDSRVSTISGLFAVNRRGGALWALAEEPGVGHVIGRSRDMAMMLFEDVLALRVRGTTLAPLTEQSGFVGDLKARTFKAAAAAPPANITTAWLPTERLARAWTALLTGAPFER
jgi:poly(3-hydroxybutyrate) depolymerase